MYNKKEKFAQVPGQTCEKTQENPEGECPPSKSSTGIIVISIIFGALFLLGLIYALIKDKIKLPTRKKNIT